VTQPDPAHDRLRGLIVHQDPALIAFNKPAGLASQGGRGVTESVESLAAPLARGSKRPLRLVHRLDRDTSGVIILARTQPAAAALSAAFAERRMRKLYLALACGDVASTDGVIDQPLRKTARAGLDLVETCAANAPGAQTAQTHYQVIGRSKGATLLVLAPLTGRMHQLRVHAQILGAPLFGDGKYGGLFALGAEPAGRMHLHAFRLHGPHPSGGALALEAPVPEDLRQIWLRLGIDLAAALSLTSSSLLGAP